MPLVQMTRAQYQAKYGAPPPLPAAPTPPAPAPQQPDPSTYSKVGGALSDFSTGFAKGALKSLQGIGNAVLSPVKSAIESATGKTIDTGISQNTLEPKNTAESLGKFTENLAEYALPGSKISSVAAGAPKVTIKLLQLAKDIGVSQAQTGGDIGAGITTAITSGLFRGLPLDIPGARNFAVKVMSKLSGYDSNVLEAALQRTPGAVEATAKGEPVLTDAVKQTITGVQDYARQLVDESKATVADLSKMSSGGAGQPGTRQGILQAGRDFVSAVTNDLRSKFNIGVQKDGSLLFDRGSLPSNIVSHADQSAIQDAFAAMGSIKNNTTIEHLDAVTERMLSLYKKTPGGSPTGPETKQIIQGMMNEIVKFSDSLGAISPAYPKYAAFLRANIPVRSMISDMKDVFGTTANPSPKDVSRISTGLLQLFNQGKSELRNFVSDIGNKVETDPVGAAAGTLLKSGDQISVRAKQLSARSLAEKVLEAIPRTIVTSFVKTGNLTTLENHPVIQQIAQALRIPAIEIAKEVGAAITPNE